MLVVKVLDTPKSVLKTPETIRSPSAKMSSSIKDQGIYCHFC